jgi:protein TonB
MSYLDRTPDPTRRTTAVAGVVAIHALLAYVLLTGLAVTFTPSHLPPLIADFVPKPPPPPTPTPQPKRPDKPVNQAETVTAPTPKTDLTDSTRIVDLADNKVIVDFPPPRPVPTFDPPKPLGFTPKPTAPRNDPARWALPDDYPSRDLREGNEGTTVFRVVVGTDGRVSACEIVRSSGHAGLDAATCKAVERRARFNPATDGNGDKVVGTYSNSVRWQIPR